MTRSSNSKSDRKIERASNPNDDVELCSGCGKRTAYVVNRDTEIVLECDCGYRSVIKYKRGTMIIPGCQNRLEG